MCSGGEGRTNPDPAKTPRTPRPPPPPRVTPRGRHDGGQHRLKIAWRAADDPQDLARRRSAAPGPLPHSSTPRPGALELARPRAFPFLTCGTTGRLLSPSLLPALHPDASGLLTFPQEPLADSWHALLQLLECRLEKGPESRRRAPAGPQPSAAGSGRPGTGRTKPLAGGQRDRGGKPGMGGRLSRPP